MDQRTPVTSELLQDLVQFIQQVRDEDLARAMRCHELLSRLSADTDEAPEPYPTDTDQPDARPNALGARLRNELGYVSDDYPKNTSASA